MKLTVVELSTFVAGCRTVEGGLELARFMEGKCADAESLPLTKHPQKFNVVVDFDGKIEIHSVLAVNDLGREDFKKYVLDFMDMKRASMPAKKPLTRVTTVPDREVRVA